MVAVLVPPEGIGGIPPEGVDPPGELMSNNSEFEVSDSKTTSSSVFASRSAWMSPKENLVPWLNGLNLSPGGSGSVWDDRVTLTW